MIAGTRPEKLCASPGCTKVAHGDWCKGHHTERARRGLATVEDFDRRMFSFIDVGDCWQWTGPMGSHGYGSFSNPYTSRRAHRAVYTRLVGPIPQHLDLDHLCRNHACVNPDHLEPVTRRENTVRGAGAIGRVAKTGLCIHGHVLPEPRMVGGRLKRPCLACDRARRPRKSLAALSGGGDGE